MSMESSARQRLGSVSPSRVSRRINGSYCRTKSAAAPSSPARMRCINCKKSCCSDMPLLPRMPHREHTLYSRGASSAERVEECLCHVLRDSPIWKPVQPTCQQVSDDEAAQFDRHST